jgi:hypothetical protein
MNNKTLFIHFVNRDEKFFCRMQKEICYKAMHGSEKNKLIIYEISSGMGTKVTKVDIA